MEKNKDVFSAENVTKKIENGNEKRPCAHLGFLKENQKVHEKDKVQILNSDHKKMNIEKGEVGEVFLVDSVDEKAFVIFFDHSGFCRCGDTFKFGEFFVTEPFDELEDLLSLLK